MLEISEPNSQENHIIEALKEEGKKEKGEGTAARK
jgi:hypothetical protein